jgi:hypothetical protein
MLTDTRIIARQHAGPGGLEVLAQRHEVMWRDGTTVTLHPVQANGLPMLALRAVALPGGQLLLVDLARLVRRLDAELRACPARDVPGHVFFTLRQAYGSAVSFTADAQRKATGSWQPVGESHVWLAAARAVDAELLATADLAARPAPAAAQWCPQ